LKLAGRLPLLLMLLLAAVFALSACGGDDTEDFANDADEICQEGTEELEDLDRPGSLDEWPEFAEDAVEIAEDTKADLEDLDPPGEVEDDWNRYLDNVDEGIELIEETSDAAEAGDEERFNELIRGDRQQELEDENEEIADEIGLEDCGRD
jgi:hypothetical protein